MQLRSPNPFQGVVGGRVGQVWGPLAAPVCVVRVRVLICVRVLMIRVTTAYTRDRVLTLAKLAAGLTSCSCSICFTHSSSTPVLCVLDATVRPWP